MPILSPINIAVLGSGGREHSIAKAVSQSPKCNKVFVIPGNDGIHNSFECISWDQKDFNILLNIIIKNNIKFVIVGPDQLLFDGVVDFLQNINIPTFGPTKNASKLEWSKLFAKQVMAESKVPTSEFILIEKNYDLNSIIQKMDGFPFVIKYDGLALGKGVSVCTNKNEANEFIKQTFEKYGTNAVLFAEKFSKGKEVSLFALTNGSNFILFDPACDHKRLNDNNLGPNTGGMGAFSPVPWFSKNQAKEIANQIFPKILSTMAKMKHPFRGLLYAGLMVDGNQFDVLEFNARFGDPETQCLLPRLQTDLLEYLYWSATSSDPVEKIQKSNQWKFNDEYSINIVLAAQGYPDQVKKGDLIEIGNLDKNTNLYFSGVLKKNNNLITNGGRVLSITVKANSLAQAREYAYSEINKIKFQNMHYRKDIGKTGVEL